MIKAYIIVSHDVMPARYTMSNLVCAIQFIVETLNVRGEILYTQISLKILTN